MSGTVSGAVDTSVINIVVIPTFPELHSGWKGAGRERFGDDNKPASTAKISDRVSAMLRIKGAWWADGNCSLWLFRLDGHGRWLGR